jgi:hypothetical protein
MFFQCSAFLSRRTSPLLHLIIGPPRVRGDQPITLQPTFRKRYHMCAGCEMDIGTSKADQL